MTLTDLAAAANVTRRTVRYYIAQGLLPPPTGSGPAASYGEEHLELLQVIKALQAAHLPLAEIRARLDAEPTPPAPPDAPDSALAYLDRLLGPGSSAAAAAAPSTPGPVDGRPASTPDSNVASRSTWQRHAFGPDVEIHVRRPLSRDLNRRVERLLDEARRILLEEP